MANLNLSTQTFEIGREYTKEELFEKLYHFCDADFNGDNGDEYYRMSDEMSDLEYCIQESMNKKESLEEMIKSVVSANYSNDMYYDGYDYTFTKHDNLLIVSVATVY